MTASPGAPTGARAGARAGAPPDARVVELAANQPPERFYAGGARIAAFRGRAVAGDHVPEDWVGSVTALFGEKELGCSLLPDGRLLRDAVSADPVAWLGPEHVVRYGADTALLVKLLDAGERLPVHAHPDGVLAAVHLGLTHGKTEAWVALAPADVHLGFRRPVAADELAGWVQRQDTVAMLAAMHTLTLCRGDAVLVPAGLPHAIGAGALVVELQEPTDLSILLEWTGFAIDGAALGHLGLGFSTALAAVDRRAWTVAEVERLRGADESVLGELLPAAAPYFRAERSRGPVRWEPGFAVVVVVAGHGTLLAGDGSSTPLRPGQTVLVPYAAGAVDVTGGDGLELLRCRPPAAAR